MISNILTDLLTFTLILNVYQQRKGYYLLDQKLFEDGISVMFDRFLSITFLFITKHSVNAKLLADDKL